MTRQQAPSNRLEPPPAWDASARETLQRLILTVMMALTWVLLWQVVAPKLSVQTLNLGELQQIFTATYDPYPSTVGVFQPHPQRIEMLVSVSFWMVALCTVLLTVVTIISALICWRRRAGGVRVGGEY